MSEVIDVAFDQAERNAYLDEVREHLPAFLSEVAYGRTDPLQDVSALLNLDSSDLRRVTATHLAFTDQIKDFVGALPEALRRPLSSSLRPPVISQSVRGPVDWPATFQTRNQQGGNPAHFVVRPAERVFDTPENQALVWFLRELTNRIEAIRPVEYDKANLMEGQSWYPHVLELGRQLTEAWRHRWLGLVQPVRPTAQTLYRLRSARNDFYASRLPAAIEIYTRYVDRPTAQDLTELLCERYFEPRLNWKLFELTIALRLVRQLGERLQAHRGPNRLLVWERGTQFARFELPSGDEIRFWYQRWPKVETISLVREAGERHRLERGSTKPDFVVERTGDQADRIVLEVKASRNAYTLRAGLVQLLGYVKDRPDFWPKETPGWLVALPDNVFEPGDAKGEPLWMVTADKVAGAVAERVLA